MALETEEITIARQLTAGIEKWNIGWCQKDDAVVGKRIDGTFQMKPPPGQADDVTIAEIKVKVAAHVGATPVGRK